MMSVYLCFLMVCMHAASAATCPDAVEAPPPYEAAARHCSIPGHKLSMIQKRDLMIEQEKKDDHLELVELVFHLTVKESQNCEDFYILPGYVVYTEGPSSYAYPNTLYSRKEMQECILKKPGSLLNVKQHDYRTAASKELLKNLLKARHEALIDQTAQYKRQSIASCDALLAQVHTAKDMAGAFEDIKYVEKEIARLEDKEAYMADTGEWIQYPFHLSYEVPEDYQVPLTALKERIQVVKKSLDVQEQEEASAKKEALFDAELVFSFKGMLRKTCKIKLFQASHCFMDKELWINEIFSTILNGEDRVYHGLRDQKNHIDRVFIKIADLLRVQREKMVVHGSSKKIEEIFGSACTQYTLKGPKRLVNEVDYTLIPSGKSFPMTEKSMEVSLLVQGQPVGQTLRIN